MMRILVLSVVFWGCSWSSSWGAYALCNETSYFLESALAQKTEEGWVSQGWFNLFPGDCHVVEEALQNPRVYYVHARALFGDATFGGEHVFCTREENVFRILGRHGCHEDEYTTAGFARVSVLGYHETVFAADPPYRSRESARVAGVQRALHQNGFVDIEIDGYWGRGTVREIKKFQKKIKVRQTGRISNTLFEQLLTNLQKQRLGLWLCNKTPYAVWAAVGILRGDAGVQAHYESQGWLKIAPAACEAAVSKIPPANSYYVYAEAVQENGKTAKRDSGKPYIWDGDLVLCVQKNFFQISGQDCARRGFEEVGFAPINIQKEERWQHLLE